MRYKKKAKAKALSLSRLKRIQTSALFILALVCLSTLPLTQAAWESDEYDNGSWCVPCQVGNRCNGGTSVAGTCTGNQYSSSRAESCTTINNKEIVNGFEYDWPSNMYFTSSTSGSCSACAAGDECDGTSTSDCTSGNTNYEISQDGTCYDIPNNFIATGQTVNSVSAAAPGKYRNNDRNTGNWGTDQMCINGVRTTCTGTTWANAQNTGCNYCPMNHYCDGTPASCSNGSYLSSFFSSSATQAAACTDCSAGYFCKKDWYGQIKVFPGTFAVADSSGVTACPAGQSCTASTGGSDCTANTYSALGNYNCYAAPQWMKQGGSGSSRTPTGLSKLHWQLTNLPSKFCSHYNNLGNLSEMKDFSVHQYFNKHFSPNI